MAGQEKTPRKASKRKTKKKVSKKAGKKRTTKRSFAGEPTHKTRQRTRTPTKREIDDKIINDPRDHSLTELEDRFCVEYVIDFNTKRAMMAAGYSESTAIAKGGEMRRRPHVAARIAELKRSYYEEKEQQRARAAEEMQRLAFSDIRNYLRVSNNGVQMLDSEDWTDDQAAAVKAVSESTTIIPQKNDDPIEKRTIKLELYSKTEALRMIGQHTGMLDNEGSLNRVVIMDLKKG